MRDTPSQSRTILFTLCLAILTAVFASPASALMVDLSPSYLAEHSDAIATGTITSVETRWDDAGTGIETVVSVSVGETLAGSLPDDPVLVVPGGTVDGITQWVEDVPAFLPGENVGLFLKELPDGTYQPVGLSQGVVPLAGGSAAKAGATGLLTPEEFADRVDAAQQGDAGVMWTTATPVPPPVGAAEVSLDAVTPATASAGTGTEVIITGTGFGTKASGRLRRCRVLLHRKRQHALLDLCYRLPPGRGVADRQPKRDCLLDRHRDRLQGPDRDCLAGADILGIGKQRAGLRAPR